MRHPWLDGLDWLVDASERLLASLDGGDRVHVMVEREKAAREGLKLGTQVVVDTRRTPDQLDDAPGLRRIERRAAEIAGHLPATEEMTVHVDFDRDIVANVHDASGTMVTLISVRAEGGGWRSADSLLIPRRILDPPLVDMASMDPWIMEKAEKALGEGRIGKGSNPISMHRRKDMLQIILPPGTVLKPPGRGT